MNKLRRWRRHSYEVLLTLFMHASGLPLIGKWALLLAGACVGPYKDRRILAQLTARPYVSPHAQIKCPNLRLGRSCFIDDGVTIYSHADGTGVSIGDRVHLYRGTILEVGQGGSIAIGDDTHIQAGCHVKGFLKSVFIGRNVQIAPHCGFSPYEHNFEQLGMPIKAQGIRSCGDIVLEDDVWLGLGVTVLEGVRISQGAVIGAGAVVTKDVPTHAVAVGVPARVIRVRGSTLPESTELGASCVENPIGQSSLPVKDL